MNNVFTTLLFSTYVLGLSLLARSPSTAATAFTYLSTFSISFFKSGTFVTFKLRNSRILTAVTTGVPIGIVSASIFSGTGRAKFLRASQ